MQVTSLPIYRYAHFNVENGFDFLLKCNFFETRSLSKPDITFVLILNSHFRALISAQALRSSDMISMIQGKKKKVYDRQIATDSEEPCAPSKVLIIRRKAGRDYCGRLRGFRHQYY